MSIVARVQARKQQLAANIGGPLDLVLAGIQFPFWLVGWLVAWLISLVVFVALFVWDGLEKGYQRGAW